AHARSARQDPDAAGPPPPAVGESGVPGARRGGGGGRAGRGLGFLPGQLDAPAAPPESVGRAPTAPGPRRPRAAGAAPARPRRDAGGAQARSPRARAPSGEQRGGVGLQLVGVHCPGYEASRPPDAVERAVERLGITYPVLVDGDLEMWREYENRGWPARYLFDGRGLLFHYHYGEGAHRETELPIQ